MSWLGREAHLFRWNLPLMRERRQIPRPRLAYIGWQGNGNLGDDAMFQAAQRLFPDYALTTFDIPVRERYLRRYHLSGGRYFDAAILGGGTLINPPWLDPVREAMAGGCRLFTLGTGVGSCGFEQPDGVETTGWKELLSQFGGVGVRGPRSKAALEAISVRSEVTGDLALALALDLPPARATDAPRVAVNIALAENSAYDGPENAFLREVEEAARTLLRSGWRIVPFAMTPADAAPVTRFLCEIGLPNQPVSLPTTADEFFALIGPCTFTMAVRLHGAILSTCVGVPPLMLGYRDKCLDFMESIGMTAWHIGLQDAAPSEIIEQATRLSYAAPALRDETLLRAREWREKLAHYAAACRQQIRP